MMTTQSTARTVTAASRPVAVDSTTLPRLLADLGFHPPRHFKALVEEIHRGTDGTVKIHGFDVHGTSRERDWWPASTVKLFAAIAALERVHALGFTPRAEVVFDDPKGPLSTTVEQVVREALIPSNNEAFDQLVEIVGFDRLNLRFLPGHGLSHTVLLRGYSGRVRDPVTRRGTLRNSRPFTLSEGEKTRRVPARVGRDLQTCPKQGNCTTLEDLADAMLRVIVPTGVPPRKRFDLGPQEVELLQTALVAERPRGNGVVDGLRGAFGPDRTIVCFHKPGYALNWFSDVVFVRRPDTGQEWIVAMAGYPGRDALDEAARLIGTILAGGSLPRTPDAPDR